MHQYATGDLTHSEIWPKHKTFQRASKNLTAKGALQCLTTWGLWISANCSFLTFIDKNKDEHEVKEKLITGQDRKHMHAVSELHQGSLANRLMFSGGPEFAPLVHTSAPSPP